jgi:hypothetical protein
MYPSKISACAALPVLALVIVFFPSVSRAQMLPMGLPINTTLVITKPAPDQIFGGRQVVTMGVGTKEYKFLLNDAYVDSPNPRIQWPDIWQQVRQSRPNFVVQGKGEDTFEKIKPGEQVTIKAMYAPLNRTLEVMNVQPGKGAFEPEKRY